MMNREINDHEINKGESKLRVVAYGSPGLGGANNVYLVDGSECRVTTINFQEGPVPLQGVNGVTNEALLAIVADRLRGFQKGSYVCRENALALTKVEEALHWLHQRTQNRKARGVEGTHVV